ncbi:MAG: hypothetical protein V9E94_20230 [Microthrixaceae bacterium]
MRARKNRDGSQGSDAAQEKGRPDPGARAVGALLVVALFLVACAPSSVPGPDQPRSCVPRIGTNQIIMPLPGLFLPLPSIKGLSEFDELAPAPEGLDLPVRVDLRDNTAGFNSYAEFAIGDGSLYTRPRGSGALWRKVRTPDCLDGHIVSVSVDSNMAVVLDPDGWIYSLDNLLSGPMLWNWTRSYGAPIWLWPGMKVPAEALAEGKWAISHRMSESFVDAKGYRHPTTAGLVQLVSLTGGGSRNRFSGPLASGRPQLRDRRSPGRALRVRVDLGIRFGHVRDGPLRRHVHAQVRPGSRRREPHPWSLHLAGPGRPAIGPEPVGGEDQRSVCRDLAAGGGMATPVEDPR